MGLIGFSFLGPLVVLLYTVIPLIVLYFVIKLAVKAALKEAVRELKQDGTL